ncbi:Mu transposase domain-containing protein [Streptomyces melanogenes]|uniref:Mu transposase domain-containing protein n=1 Tax=Streptomyces melanogenes TaxID=67326 RepID=UPI0037884462
MLAGAPTRCYLFSLRLSSTGARRGVARQGALRQPEGGSRSGVPVPEVASFAEPHELVDQWDQEDEVRRICSRPRTVGEYFAFEQPLFKPLPVEPFETGSWFTPRVDRYGQITVRSNRYSVPVRLIGKTLRGASARFGSGGSSTMGGRSPGTKG